MQNQLHLAPLRRRSCVRLLSRVPLASLLLAGCATAVLAQPLPLRQGARGLPIFIGASPNERDRFAASELARYLGKMTGAAFQVHEGGAIPAAALVVGRGAVASLYRDFDRQPLGNEGFLIRREGARVLIAGAGERGTLYGVYALLEKLGCRWFAPGFSFYGTAGGELVPKIQTPLAEDWSITERPAFEWRKLYIEEGHSHTVENLTQMVDWMAKARMNVLDCPIDYQHLHHTEWDHWRAALIPELRKRGILIEVGGHGYPNFLPEDKYFAAHPDWFGMRDGKRSQDPRVVFSTANPDAVRTFVENVKIYLKAHPEIDIFDAWPPDGAQWSEAPEDVALGDPSERQVVLLNHLAAQLKPDFSRLRVQFIAYESYTPPPKVVKPARGVLMEFCPIDRTFESPLYASGYPENERYFYDLQGWLSGVMDPQDITIYSYITKYAWRSLPILIPHLIVEEARRFDDMGIGGLATYSEPGNWATYELDHYITAKALWNPQIDASQELGDYTSERYGAAGPFILGYLRLVEDVVPHAVGIPGVRLAFEKQRMMIDQFSGAGALLEQAQSAAAHDPGVQILLAKLEQQYRYAENEMEIQLALLTAPRRLRAGQLPSLGSLLTARTNIINEDPTNGVILHDGRIP